MKTQVAVIGAGPAGLIAAEVISSKGVNTTVFEEHGQVGTPDHCCGIISVEGFKRLGVPLLKSFHLNTVYGGRLYSKNGTCLEIRDKKPRAHIIDRKGFDQHLAIMALEAGADIRTSTRVEEIVVSGERVVGVKTGGYSVRSDYVINAEGARGRLLSKAGIGKEQRGVITGFNVDLSGVELEPDMVEVWFNDEVSKDFFTWVAPLSETRARVGLGTSRGNGIRALKSFIKKRFGDVEVPRIRGGLLCTGGSVGRTGYPGLMLVGDVAGQVKPTTGGGVVVGGLCSRLAGEAAVKGILGDDHKAFSWYENEWRRQYEDELSTMLMLRKMLNGVGDDRLSRIFEALKTEELSSKLSKIIKEGDMDMQASVIRKAFTDPEIVTVLVRAAGRVAVSELLTFFGF